MVLVEQYRPRIGETFLACPAGRVESGESFVEAGVRELREETGFRADGVELLERYYPDSNLRNQRGVVFADQPTPGEQDLEVDEFLSVRTVPAEEVFDAVRNGPCGGWGLTPLLLAREQELL